MASVNQNSGCMLPAERRSIIRFVIPNGVTTISLLIGLWALTCASRGEPENAAWWILVSVLLDKLDGTFARLLNGSSDFGVQLDSLSDLICFGLAPAATVAVFTSSLPSWWAGGMEWLLWACCATLPVAAAWRLAKFNVITSEMGSKYFLGIPTTHVGGLVATSILVASRYSIEGAADAMPVLSVGFSFWMISSLPMPKLQATDSRLMNIVLVVNVAAAYILVPMRMFPELLFAQALLYAVGGTLTSLRKRSSLKAPLLFY
ncbi:MAG: CDP-alcohol phosphatidyltransferase family protein [Myxococcota bacterium]|nr:CDP-alcohol phosphatidyltransferase family protein [Myxococcota bacterium]